MYALDNVGKSGRLLSVNVKLEIINYNNFHELMACVAEGKY